MIIYSSGNVALSASEEVIVITPVVSTIVQRPACGVTPITFTSTNELAETFGSVITQVLAVEPHSTVAGVLYLDQPS
jgi:hypothetical protein